MSKEVFESKPVRLLYVEDDEGLARLLQKKLERSGYIVDTVHNGKDGLAKYETGNYDTILVDLNLPIVNGMELVRKITSMDNLLPLIMVTGDGDESTAVDAMKLGVDDYIVKDFNNRFIELLPAVIENAINKKQLAKDKLRMEENLRWLNRCIESVSETVVITDIQGSILYTNPSFTKLTGYTAAEALGQNPRILRTDRHT